MAFCIASETGPRLPNCPKSEYLPETRYFEDNLEGLVLYISTQEITEVAYLFYNSTIQRNYSPSPSANKQQTQAAVMAIKSSTHIRVIERQL